MNREAQYRADIDGLRSFAILPILLFHANIPGFSGGFVGVDVFFVISGYLITGIIAKEVRQGNFSIFNFYERRLRRIFPALIAMLFFVLLASPFFLLPSEFSSLPKQVIGSIFFVANIVFWKSSGYFSTDAETMPLLHMWSLGVEEQFYLFAPIFFFLILHYANRWRFILTTFVLLASLGLCISLTFSKPNTSFYLVPTRAWELLTGSLLALWHIEKPIQRSPWHELAAATGMVCLFSAVFFFSPDTPFPGYSAILPITGSALLIGFAQHTWMGKFLSMRLLVIIGLSSYSLYLWHWPLVVFFRGAGWLESMPGRWSVVAVSIIFAWLSLRYIETPTRIRTTLPTNRLLTAATTGVVLLCGASLAFYMLDGWPSRFSIQTLAFDQARHDVSPARDRCHKDSGLPIPSKSCVLGGKEPHIAVWSDSHGVELAQAIADTGFPVRSITYSACPPIIDEVASPSRPYCQQHNHQVLDYLVATPQLQIIILVAYYGNFNERVDGMVKTAATLRSAGKRVVVVGPTPNPGKYDVPSHLARGGLTHYRKTSLQGDYFIQEFNGVADVFLPETLFCIEDECNLLYEGKPIFFDKHHPSMSAARITAKALERLFISSMRN